MKTELIAECLAWQRRFRTKIKFKVQGLRHCVTLTFRVQKNEDCYNHTGDTHCFNQFHIATILFLLMQNISVNLLGTILASFPSALDIGKLPFRLRKPFYRSTQNNYDVTNVLRKERRNLISSGTPINIFSRLHEHGHVRRIPFRI